VNGKGILALHYAGAVELSTYSLQLANFSRARYLEPRIMPSPNGTAKEGPADVSGGLRGAIVISL
jgi:hypothetical protein